MFHAWVFWMMYFSDPAPSSEDLASSRSCLPDEITAEWLARSGRKGWRLPPFDLEAYLLFSSLVFDVDEWPPFLLTLLNLPPPLLLTVCIWKLFP